MELSTKILDSLPDTDHPSTSLSLSRQVNEKLLLSSEKHRTTMSYQLTLARMAVIKETEYEFNPQHHTGFERKEKTNAMLARRTASL